MNPDSILVKGGKTLYGDVSIQGSKNAALPILAAAVLYQGKITLRNVPDLKDVHEMLQILTILGTKYIFKNNTLVLDCKDIKNNPIPLEFTETIRASTLFMGPLVGRFGYCHVGMPGGCNIGARPIDIHIHGLETMGNVVKNNYDSIFVEKKEEKECVFFELEKKSVGATENLIMASVLHKGIVTLKNVAIEPEIIQLVDFLNQSGAKISQPDSNTFVIEGVLRLKENMDFEIQSDRIEAGTFLIAGLATEGSVRVIGVEPHQLESLLIIIEKMGGRIETEKKSVRVSYHKELKGVEVQTDVYPGFPTDLQPQISALLTKAKTNSMITENIFENRMKHFEELKKMNAMLHYEGNSAEIKTSALYAVPVSSYDLRGAAAMIIAGLMANGTSRIKNLNHLFRGYEAFPEKLAHLGASLCYF